MEPIILRLSLLSMLFYGLTVQAAVIQSNYYTSDGSLPVGVAVSNADLLQTSLASATRTGTAAGDRYFYREDSGYTVDLGRLTDGAFGTAGGMSAYSVLPNQVTLTFTLNLTANPSGHTVTAIRTYAGWDSGRDGQEYTVQYSQVSDPTNFITLRAIDRYNIPEANFAYEAYEPSFLAMMRRMIPSYPAGRYITNQASTMVELTSSSGPLAVNVAAIRFVFGNYDTNTNAFENGGTAYREIDVIGSAPPTVTSISPNSGSTEGGTAITITGTDFTGATAVTLGGTAAIDVTVVSSTTITATTPAGSAGTASVLVTTPEGTNAANTLFTYLSAANNPTFGTPTSTAVGFTVQISNYDNNFTYGGTATASGTVAISGTGVVTVSGVAANTSSTATITTARTNYASGSATVTATSSLAAASTPAFGSTTRTTDGFTVQISNYNASYTWAGTATASGTVVVSGTGLVTVSGVAANTSSTATITTTRTGYVGGSATVTATSLAVPSAPTAVSVTSGNAQATVTFTAPGDNGGAAITGYTVTSNPAGGTDSNAGSTSLSHVITGLTNGTAYTFTVTATNSVGTSSASSASSAVTPILPVAITTQPSNLTVAQGYPASFTVAASGTVPLTYQWLKNGIAISGATSATYSIATVATTDAGSYTVTITNAAGNVTSSAATLTVQAFNVLTTNQNVIAGKSAAFTTGVSLGSTQWQISTDAGVTWTNLTNNTTYDGVTTNVLEILKVTAAMSKNRYRYQVTINNQITTSTAGVITVGTAFLLLPVGVQVDASGNLYVSDAAGQTVRKISSDFKISTLTGNALSQGSTDGVAGNAKLNEPTGLVLNADNSLLLADTSNAALRQISTVGTVTTFAGTSGSKGSTDATGTAARFSAPVGLTRDGSGNYYVADQTNHTIRKISASGVVTTLAGTAGQSGSVDGTGVAARLNLPTGITCNAQGDLYVSDLGSHLIRKITAAGVVTTLAGQAGVSGSTDGSGTAALFFKPSGLAIDSAGNLYVADMGNSTLRKISASGVVSTLAGLPTIDGLMDGTGSNAWFAEPQGLTLDSAGNIYVADTANAVLRKVTPEGLVTTLALAGTAPLISTQPASITINSFGTATFSVLAIGDAPLSYQWKKDGADISGAVYPSYSISSVSTFYAGNYTVAVTNAYGTTLSNTATLTVNGSAPDTVNPPPATSSGGGGGGAVSPWFIGALGFLLLVRRTRRRE